MTIDSKLMSKLSFNDFKVVHHFIDLLKEKYRYQAFEVNYAICKIITKLLDRWNYKRVESIDDTIKLSYIAYSTFIYDYVRCRDITINIYVEPNKPMFTFSLSYDGRFNFFYKKLGYSHIRPSLDYFLEILCCYLRSIKYYSDPDNDPYNEDEIIRYMGYPKRKDFIGVDSYPMRKDFIGVDDIHKEIDYIINNDKELKVIFNSLKEYDNFLARIRNQYDNLCNLRNIIKS